MSNPVISAWLQTLQGRYILDWEQSRFDLMVADIFGFNAVQIGLPECDCLRANRMPLRFIYDSDMAPPAGAVGDPHHLPLAGNSVDLVVLPHVLEFAADPHQILREVERVLVPEGQVLISGFNPRSLWGVKRRLAGRDGAFPWQGQYFSVRRLKDLLTLLSFETQAGCFGRYLPAVMQEKWLRRWRFLELAGERWWPIAGAVYLLQGVKRQHGLRLLTPAWQDRKARAKALSLAVRRIQKDDQ
ncbi:MAG: class I SAM-dependent methyltransferase [Zoogloeaceae bacterium]|jgi:SAM-dependent methyltransferase|nr:class I SAM-dependent methyltransferase [Zoogloeaceae bacterium]